MSRLSVARLLAVALFVAACAGAVPASVGPGSSLGAAATESPSPSPTAASSVTASPVATATGGPPASAAPSESPPAATPTASPTSRPTASPKPTATAAPTRTAAPTPKPTAKPTPKPTTKPTAKPTSKPVVLALEARDFQFAPASLNAPADQPFGIKFSNADQAVPHNVTITTAAGSSRFSGQIVTGVASMTYVVPALAAGSYRLGCIVHPAMTGTLTVR